MDIAGKVIGKEASVTGKEIRLNRILGEGMNAVIVAVDHCATFGPIDGLVDFRAALDNLRAADGILLNPGMLDHCGSVFAGKGCPRLIARTTWTTAYCFPWNYKEAHTTMVMRPAEALRRGADMVVACCLVQSGDQRMDRDNVKLFSEIVAQKERAGIPLVGELYPAEAEQMPESELQDRICRGSRILAELGADAIKTFYTGDGFAEIVEAVPVPILVLGAAKMAEEKNALEMAHKAIASGARGVVFGRNVFQTKDPAAFLEALLKVVHERSKSEDVLR